MILQAYLSHTLPNWPAHFRSRPPLEFQPFAAETITPAEWRRIAASIAEFQRGESSEARDYLAKCARFAAEADDSAFLEAAVLFVKEENGHSAMLEAFMVQHHMPPAAHSWTDAVFRWVRSWGDIGWSTRVLLAAELVAQVYYPALKEATASGMLALICDRIIEDEAFHIQFQTERITLIERRRGPLYRMIHAAAGLALYLGTIIVVWFDHRRVLAHSLSFSSYLKACWARYKCAMRKR